ncbi:signal transduction histidine kinase [Flavobacterium sp. 7E]|uniref:hybrid sensor histidine kinase/response regulator n=1 Tax=unclassified Flavobacterium TaxID=196869 RepID=UPI00156E3B2B|nr:MULTISPECIES: response regulator [unclassified Flavobacterium]MBE0393493.1 Phytochrome-like protein cph1 [Flavobacterium sp. PL002]NRS88835.1 signal transduction histidine kinase [Flavobacterium sp. 7E]NRT15870.1 signal transduction histidine kinase [Flavobacterium sp. 28A]
MILIVDDIKANIIALKKILELHNLDVDSAESGEEALKKILKNDYALIIMDVQMPGMDGFEVAEILAGNNRTKDIPVIFLSAVNKQKKFISKGYETGGVDYITKPVDSDLLILKVKTFLKIYQQQKELIDIRDLLSKEVEVRKEAQENLEVKIAERTKELVTKNEELELKNHELQQFSWVVSHDLKEPLRKIQIFINIIKDKYLLEDEKAIDYVNRTVKAAERMQNLITDLLEYSRLSAKVNPEKAPLEELAIEVVNDLDYLIEDKKAVVNINKLPTINGIPTQLRQVFQNLIGNSLKFAKKDVLPVIDITSELIEERSFDSNVSESGKFCRISIKDNGIGFDDQYLNKIFMIFQSLSDRKVYEGTGIGLAIAKKIIEKHNGLITAISKEGEGANFIIVLPLDFNS